MTTRVNNGSINTPLMNPLSSPRTEADKASDAPATGAPARATTPSPQAAPSAGVTKKAADVSISHGAKDRAEAFQKALDIARRTPDVREDRVADLKKRIADGTYQVDSGNIADGMLREAIKEHLANQDR